MVRDIVLKYPNYVAAFILCIAGTVMALLTNNKDVYWLFVSDLNVALWLFVAAFLDPKR